jgi:hypothetical protein
LGRLASVGRLDGGLGINFSLDRQRHFGFSLHGSRFRCLRIGYGYPILGLGSGCGG